MGIDVERARHQRRSLPTGPPTRRRHASAAAEQFGSDYLNNRYHDPSTGLFLSVDPLVATTGTPYLYADGNPTTLSDPTGLEPCPKTGCSADDSGGRAPCSRSAFSDGSGVCAPGTHRHDLMVGYLDWSNCVKGALATCNAGAGKRSVQEAGRRLRTFVDYLTASGRRQVSNPAQSIWDLLSGTTIIESASAAEAILGEGAKVYSSGEYCGKQMECLIGASSGKSAITTGHTVRFEHVPRADLVAHEAEHVYDIEAVGGVGFYGSYAVDYVLSSAACQCDGYEDIGWEQRGYYIQNDYDSGARPTGLWADLRHLLGAG